MLNYLLNAMRSGANPENLLMQFLMSQNTPLSTNLLDKVQKGDVRAIEQIARNICSQRGVNFDTEFKAFRNKFGL